jgi:hypothetical protein
MSISCAFISGSNHVFPFRDHLSQREPCNWGLKLVAPLFFVTFCAFSWQFRFGCGFTALRSCVAISDPDPSFPFSPHDFAQFSPRSPV